MLPLEPRARTGMYADFETLQISDDTATNTGSTACARPCAKVKQNSQETPARLPRSLSALSPSMEKYSQSSVYSSMRSRARANEFGEDEDQTLPFEAIIHITNSDAVVQLHSPWKVHSPRTSTGTGFSIGGKRILTNHHVVAFSTSLRVFKHGVPGNYPAKVLCESAVCDLALLTVEDDSFWEDLPCVSFQDKVPELDDTVCAVGYPLNATSVTLTRGVVSNVQLSDLSLTGYQEEQLTVQIDAAINPGNSGGPVFNQTSGDVVGVAFSGLDDAEGMGFIIPTPVVRNFLDVYDATGTAQRLPNLGIDTQKLTNSEMRTLLFGMGTPPKHHHGVLITAVKQFSCAETAGVLPGDLLMAIDGIAISEEGEVPFRNHERVGFQYLITRKKVGEQAQLSVQRSTNGPKAASGFFDINALVSAQSAPIPLELTVTLTATHDLVPRELGMDYKPEFVIIGGLVFVIAGLPLYEQAREAAIDHPEGSVAIIKYAMRALLEPPISMMQTSGTDEDAVRSRHTEALLCTDCLAHDVNEGYHRHIGNRLSMVNGTAVENLKHAVELLSPILDASRPPPTSHVVLQFYGSRKTAVFGTEALRMAMPIILRQHKIPYWASLDNASSLA